MTAQINDTCFHRKIDFAVAGISGTGLFDPSNLGFQPVSMSTACWRGYVAHYSVIDSQLYLTSLHLGLSNEDAIRARAGNGPQIFGISPQPDRFAGFIYEGLQSPVNFTGGLLIADDFIRDLYVHMGFHPAWKYKNVREVIFDAGYLVDDFDRSLDMEKARLNFIRDSKETGNKPNIPSRVEIEAWIEKCFSRNY